MLKGKNSKSMNTQQIAKTAMVPFLGHMDGGGGFRCRV
jgi:hypothetical protein